MTFIVILSYHMVILRCHNVILRYDNVILRYNCTMYFEWFLRPYIEICNQNVINPGNLHGQFLCWTCFDGSKLNLHLTRSLLYNVVISVIGLETFLTWINEKEQYYKSKLPFKYK